MLDFGLRSRPSGENGLDQYAGLDLTFNAFFSWELEFVAVKYCLYWLRLAVVFQLLIPSEGLYWGLV